MNEKTPTLPELFSRREIAVTRTVWAVTFGNYEPAEIDSLWESEQDADKRAAQLEGDWRVCQMAVYNFAAAPEWRIDGE